MQYLVTSQGRIQDFKEGGSTIVMHAKHAQKKLSHAHFRWNQAHLCVLFGVVSAAVKYRSNEVSQSMSLLANIFVFKEFRLHFGLYF